MRNSLASFATAAMLLSACGGGGGDIVETPLPRMAAATPIEGVGTGSNFAFDIGAVMGNRYYVTDRNNKSVDVFDTGTSRQLAQIKGTGANAFAGQAVTSTGAADNSRSGPNGIAIADGLLYVWATSIRSRSSTRPRSKWSKPFRCRLAAIATTKTVSTARTNSS